MTEDLLDVLMDLRDRRRTHAIATVVKITGSSSAKPGAKAVIDEGGRVVSGWVGGGCAESMTCSLALKCMNTGETAVLDIELNSEVRGAGMPCGGSMRVYVEPVIPRPALWILGHGRIAESLCAIGSIQGLEVHVIDPLVDRERYPDATKRIARDPDHDRLLPSSGDYVVIATQHRGDYKSLTRALRSEVAYVALIASTKRSRRERATDARSTESRHGDG